MGAVAPFIPLAGSLIGGLTGGAQQSQANTQGNQLISAESGMINDLMKNFTTNVLPVVQSLIGGGAGGGPIGSLFSSSQAAGNQLNQIGTGLENANVFPSAGTSTMNTLLSRIGTIANPGAAVADASRGVAQAGMEGQIAAKQAGASIIGQGAQVQQQGLQSGIGDIMSLLGLQTSPMSSNLGNLGTLGQTKLNQAGAMGSPWGDAISSITQNFPGLNKAGGAPAIQSGGPFFGGTDPGLSQIG